MKQRITAIISLFALALILALSSCDNVAGGPVGYSGGSPSGGSGGGSGIPITITLPPIGSASIRALNQEQVSRLQRETASYRVVFNGGGQNITRSGSSRSFSASFPVGTVVGITVYCLNAEGEVIVKTVTKTITVRAGSNKVEFKLSEDGTELKPDTPTPEPVPPAPPAPVIEYVNITFNQGFVYTNTVHQSPSTCSKAG